MSKTLHMSAKEIDRTHIMRQIAEGAITLSEGCIRMGITERHGYRLLARYRLDGDDGLVHRMRGRLSNNAYPRECREPILELFRTRFADYGPTLFSEKVEEIYGYIIDAETLRRWLIEAKLWSPGTHRNRHRKKRPRREAIGSLVQIDGSHHPWFEDRGPDCCLFVFIDDASNQTYFRFAESENTFDALVSLRKYVERYGIFEQAYTDRGTVFRDQRGKETVFAKALYGLHCSIIYARSPQAKGRVERVNRTHQDRLVKALRERNISSIEEANQFLEEQYIDKHNERFAHTDGLPNIHRPVGTLNLDNIICFVETRAVARDMTFPYKAHRYQILPGRGERPIPGQRVTIRIWLDGSLHAFWREAELPISECKEYIAQKGPALHHPADDHPWRHAQKIGKAKRLTIEQLCKSPR